MPMTKNQAAQVRRILEVAAGTVPPTGDHAIDGVALDAAVSDMLELAPVLPRPWHRLADAYTLEQLEAAEAAEADAGDDAGDDDAPDVTA